MGDLASITHTARRQHRCAGRGLTVHAGEQYVRARLPGGGRAAKQAFHRSCYVALAAAADKGIR